MFEFEPKVSAELKEMKNVVLNPHLGSATVEVREEMANIVVDNIEAVLKGQTPPGLRQSGSVGCKVKHRVPDAVRHEVLHG